MFIDKYFYLYLFYFCIFLIKSTIFIIRGKIKYKKYILFFSPYFTDCLFSVNKCKNIFNMMKFEPLCFSKICEMLF